MIFGVNTLFKDCQQFRLLGKKWKNYSWCQEKNITKVTDLVKLE